MSAKATAARATERLRVKRVYARVEGDDGFRVLVDRLWPRGLTKEKAHIDQWLKDVAPSDTLRRRIHADPEKWDEFITAYDSELQQEPAKSAAASLRERLRHGPVTLLFAARDEHRNNATALRKWLERKR